MNHNEIETIANIHQLAFGVEEGDDVAKLVKGFLALPETISINATHDKRIVGNILFTPFFFHDHPNAKCYLLAPLGVLPEFHGQGFGKKLMESGIEHLTSINADVIFVLGVPTFYPKYGFSPTDQQTPYPDLLTITEAWMALELSIGSIEPLSGNTYALEPIMQSEFWDTSGRE